LACETGSNSGCVDPVPNRINPVPNRINPVQNQINPVFPQNCCWAVKQVQILVGVDPVPNPINPVFPHRCFVLLIIRPIWETLHSTYHKIVVGL